MKQYALTKNDIDLLIISEVQEYIKDAVTIKKQLFYERVIPGLQRGLTTLPTEPWSDIASEKIISNTFKALKLKPREGASDDEVKFNPAEYAILTQNDLFYLQDDHIAVAYKGFKKYGYTVTPDGLQLYTTTTPSDFDPKKNSAGFFKFKGIQTVPGYGKTGSFELSIKKQKEAQKQKITRDKESAETWDLVAEWSSILAHATLDVVGFFDWYGVGTTADLVNSMMYCFEKQYFFAALSMIASIPGVGSVIAIPIKYIFKTGKQLVRAGVGIGKAVISILEYILQWIKPSKTVLKLIKDGWAFLFDMYRKAEKALLEKFKPSLLQQIMKQVDEGLEAGKEYLDELYSGAKQKWASSSGVYKKSAKLQTIDPAVVQSQNKLYSSSKFNHYMRRWTSLTFDESAMKSAGMVSKFFEKYGPNWFNKFRDFIIHAFTVRTPQAQMKVILTTMQRIFKESMLLNPSAMKALNAVAKRKIIRAESKELKQILQKYITDTTDELYKFTKNVVEPTGFKVSSLPKNSVAYNHALHYKQYSKIHAIDGKLVQNMRVDDFYLYLSMAKPKDLTIMVNGVESALDVERLIQNPSVAEHVLGKSKDGIQYLKKWLDQQINDMNPIYVEYITDPANAIKGKWYREIADADNGLRTLITNQLTDARRYLKYIMREISAGVQVATDTGIAGDPNQRGQASSGLDQIKYVKEIPGISKVNGLLTWFENDPQAQNSVIGALFANFGNKTRSELEFKKQQMEDQMKYLTGPENKRDVYVTPSN